MNHMLIMYTIHDNLMMACVCKDVSIYYSSTNIHKTKTGIICFFLMVLRTCSSICLKDGVAFYNDILCKGPQGRTSKLLKDVHEVLINR